MVIREYYGADSAKSIRKRKLSYFGIAVATILAFCSIAIVISSGGFFAGGVLCFATFASAFVLSVYSITSLFSLLLDARDAKRFVRERILERGANSYEAALVFNNIEPPLQDDNHIEIGGYCSSILGGSSPVFHIDDKGNAYSNHYECSSLIGLTEELYWYVRRFALDTPTVSYEESGGFIQYKDIVSVSRITIPFTNKQKNEDKVFIYPCLCIQTNSDKSCVFSIAHFDPLEEEKDRSQKEEVIAVYKMILEKQNALKVDSNLLACFSWDDG